VVFTWRVRWALFLAAGCIAAGVAAGATAATPLPLRERVLRTRELGGLVVPGRRQFVTSIDLWSMSSPYTQTANLRRAGFVRGLREGYGPIADNGIGAGSFVAEFRSAAGARYEVASEIHAVHPPAPTYVAFPVADIPRAHGYTLTAPGFVGYFVIFDDGRFQYQVSFGSSPWANHLHGPAIKAQTIAAAQSLYRRVHGR